MIKELIKEYKGQAHDIYMARFTSPCNNKELIKKSLYDYCNINKINTYMGIDFINIYQGNMSCEFYMIKD